MLEDEAIPSTKNKSRNSVNFGRNNSNIDLQNYASVKTN